MLDGAFAASSMVSGTFQPDNCSGQCANIPSTWRTILNVKEAVQTAISYTNDLFGSENISNLGLEEVTFDETGGEWAVTVGFSRPWDYSKGGTLSALSNPTGRPERSFKVIHINEHAEVLAVKNRPSGE